MRLLDALRYYDLAGALLLRLWIPDNDDMTRGFI